MKVVILDRNKQYFTVVNSIIKVDLLNINVGEKYHFNKILFIDNEDNLVFGNPYILNKIVVSEVVSHIKDKKKIILKFKRRKGYLKKHGHRQNYTLLKILSVEDK